MPGTIPKSNWRIVPTAAGAETSFFVAEIEMRTVAGGADVCNGGFTSNQAGGNCDAAFDNNLSTDYTGTFPDRMVYSFGGFSVEVIEVAITASATQPSLAPQQFTLQYINASFGYEISFTVTGQTGWAAGETRVFPAVTTVTGVTSLPVTHHLGAQGGTSFAINHILAQQGSGPVFTIRHRPQLSSPTTLTIQHIPQNPSGLAGFVVRHRLIATSKTSLGITHHANQPVAPATPGQAWQMSIMLDGVDVSASITGLIDIEANAGAARLADFVMRPAAGVIDPQAWVKKTVTIDYLVYLGGVLQTQNRRFTGFVVDAVYDPITRLVSFACSDLLQEVFEGVERDFIDTEIGGYYSDIIFNETESGWEYAQQRLESISSFYDKNTAGAGRKWDAAAGAATTTLTTSDIIESSITLAQAAARDIINTIDIEFDYRLPRKWQRELQIYWAFPQTFTEWLGQSQIRMPNKTMFLNALGSSWWVKSTTFGELPASGEFNGVNWVNHPEYELITSASATVATRWLQDVTEQYRITIKSDASVAKFGEIKETATYATYAPEEAAHEEEMALRPGAIIANITTANSVESPDYKAPEAGSTALNQGDYYLDAPDRTEFDNAIQTAIAIARQDILDSHHKNEIACKITVDPALDIGQTITINTPQAGGTGVLVQLHERYDLDAGSALADLSVNIYAPSVGGQVDDPIAVPSRPEVTPPTYYPLIDMDNHVGGVKTSRDLSGNVSVISDTTSQADPDWRGLLTNYTFTLGATPATVFYPFEFRVEMPEVEADLREEQEFTAQLTLDVAIPQETITISA